MDLRIMRIDLSKKEIMEYVEILECEEYSKSEKRDAVDELDMYNISIELRGINMLQYTILSTFKNFKIITKERKLEFEEPCFENEYLKSEYNILIDKYKEIRRILKDKYNVDKKTLEYLEPMSRLLDIRMSMSIKEFLVFIKTCNKYDELIDISVCINDCSRLAPLFTILENVKTNEIFLRFNSDKIKLEDGVQILSDKEFIFRSLMRDNMRIKISSIVYMSFVAFRDINKIFTNFNIRLDNPKHIDEKNVEILPITGLPELDEEDINLIDKYLYDWLDLYKKVKNESQQFEVVGLCILGCFGTVVGVNSPYSTYYAIVKRLQKESEAREMMIKILKNVDRL